MNVEKESLRITCPRNYRMRHAIRSLKQYIFTVYWFKTRRVLREPSAVACEEARS